MEPERGRFVVIVFQRRDLIRTLLGSRGKRPLNLFHDCSESGRSVATDLFCSAPSRCGIPAEASLRGRDCHLDNPRRIGIAGGGLIAGGIAGAWFAERAAAFQEHRSGRWVSTRCSWPPGPAQSELAAVRIVGFAIGQSWQKRGQHGRVRHASAAPITRQACTRSERCKRAPAASITVPGKGSVPK
jgi:hypothetical protein